MLSINCPEAVWKLPSVVSFRRQVGPFLFGSWYFEKFMGDFDNDSLANDRNKLGNCCRMHSIGEHEAFKRIPWCKESQGNGKLYFRLYGLPKASCLFGDRRSNLIKNFLKKAQYISMNWWPRKRLYSSYPPLIRGFKIHYLSKFWTDVFNFGQTFVWN